VVTSTLRPLVLDL